MMLISKLFLINGALNLLVGVALQLAAKVLADYGVNVRGVTISFIFYECCFE